MGEERKFKSIFKQPEPPFSESSSWNESRGIMKRKSQGYTSSPRNAAPGSKFFARANSKFWFRPLENLKHRQISPPSPWHTPPPSKTENNVWLKLKITIIQGSRPRKNKSLQSNHLAPFIPSPFPPLQQKGSRIGTQSEILNMYKF